MFTPTPALDNVHTHTTEKINKDSETRHRGPWNTRKKTNNLTAESGGGGGDIGGERSEKKKGGSTGNTKTERTRRQSVC